MKENETGKRKRSDKPTNVKLDTKPTSTPSLNTTHELPQIPEPVALDRLRNFILFKSFDIIGNGGYRRFVLKNKNNGEKWVTTIYNDSQHVSRYVRTILNLVNRPQFSASCVKLHKLCQRVINDLNPPTTTSHGWCIFALTGMRTENTTQLGRSNKGDPCHVHHKFYKFFCMLWFVTRIELCIKYFTLQWLQKHNSEIEQNIQVLCERFEADTEYIQAMSDKFSQATHHVATSVLTHLEHTSRGSMLNTSSV
jgi:hypothetical protein